MDFAALHAAILAALDETPRPAPEVTARVRAAGHDVTDELVRFELRVLRGQLRVTEEAGGWRLVDASTAISMLASRAPGLRMLIGTGA